MQNPQTLKEAYRPLYTWLDQFERELYLSRPEEEEFDDIQELISNLVKNVCLFDEPSRNIEAKLLEARIRRVYKNLKMKENEGVKDVITGRVINIKPVSKKKQQALFDNWQADLGELLMYILAEQKNTVDDTISSTISSKVILQPITLCGDFQVKDMPDTFIPKLTPKTAALFFKYLQAAEIMPKEWDPSAISKLSTAFFKVSNDNTRQAFSKMRATVKKDKDKHHLKLKSLMETVIKEIEKDLKLISV